MKVTVFGASDDLIEFEGDIYDEHNYSSNAKKYYVYCEDILQFVFQIKYNRNGIWEIVVKPDEKTYTDEDIPLKAKNWKINLHLFGTKETNPYSMVLEIDSGEDIFEIRPKRLKR